jgi:hypothetical protein
MTIHPSQIIDSGDVSIDHSTDGVIWLPVDNAVAYGFALNYAVREHVKVPDTYPSTQKISRKVQLGLSLLETTYFTLPDPCWIKIRLFLGKDAIGDNWYWSRSAKYIILDDRELLLPDDRVGRQYQLSSGNEVLSYREIYNPAIPTIFMASAGGRLPLGIFELTAADYRPVSNFQPLIGSEYRVPYDLMSFVASENRILSN